MATEFEKRLRLLKLDTATESKVKQVLSEAGSEFPCLSCPSKDECANFRWFVKWFGKYK